MTAACVTASKLIHRWRPKYLVMTGIAAGTSDSLEFGDVVIAETCYDYGSGKIHEVEGGPRKFIPSPRQLSICPKLKALLQQWESTQRCMKEIGTSWTKSGEVRPSLRLGVVATGAAVVESESLIEEIKEHSRKVVALEMEAYGVFQAAHLSTHPKPRIFVAKSISDFASPAKNDDAQRLAAFTSAEFVHAFFTQEADLEI